MGRLRKVFIAAVVSITVFVGLRCSSERVQPDQEQEPEVSFYPEYPKGEYGWLSTISTDSLRNIIVDQRWLERARASEYRGRSWLWLAENGPYAPARYLDTLLFNRDLDVHEMIGLWRVLCVDHGDHWSFRKYQRREDTIFSLIAQRGLAAPDEEVRNVVAELPFIGAHSTLWNPLFERYAASTPPLAEMLTFAHYTWSDLLLRAWVSRASMGDMQKIILHRGSWEQDIVQEAYTKKGPTMPQLERVICGENVVGGHIFAVYLRKGPSKRSLMRVLAGGGTYPEIWKRFQELHPTAGEYYTLRTRLLRTGNMEFAGKCETELLVIAKERKLRRIAEGR